MHEGPSALALSLICSGMQIQNFLTYKFWSVEEINPIGSWSEDKFFKLLLFRNLYRQQGNNSNKKLIGWFHFSLVLLI